MQKEKKLDIAIQYFLIIIIVYLSGSIYFISLHYSKAVISIFFLFLGFFLLKKKSPEFSLKLIIYVLSYSILILITIVLNGETRFDPYLALILQIFIAIMLCYLVAIEDFKKIFVNIIVFLAFVSLICFVIQFKYPTIVYYFPKSIGEALNYYNAGIYVFCEFRGFEEGWLVLQNRNAGIFWEPGAYQAFLNIGLFFILDNIEKGKKNKKDNRNIIILITTILTTYSTTGYIILFLIAFFYRKYFLKRLFKNALTSFISLTIFVAGLFVINKYALSFGYILEKIVNQFSSKANATEPTQNVLERLYLSTIKFIFNDNNFYFFGMSVSKLQKIPGSGSANSIIDTLLNVGVPLTALLLSQFYKFSLYFQKKPIVFFVILLMMFSSESLLLRPFFLFFAFSSIIHISSVRSEVLEIESTNY